MIGGGNWIKQDKKLNGSYVGFKSNRKSKRNVRTVSGSGAGGGEPMPENALLTSSGAYLMTSEGEYLTVKVV